MTHSATSFVLPALHSKHFARIAFNGGNLFIKGGADSRRVTTGPWEVLRWLPDNGGCLHPSNERKNDTNNLTTEDCDVGDVVGKS